MIGFTLAMPPSTCKDAIDSRHQPSHLEPQLCCTLRLAVCPQVVPYFQGVPTQILKVCQMLHNSQKVCTILPMSTASLLIAVAVAARDTAVAAAASF
jgi:hypothetical protein